MLGDKIKELKKNFFLFFINFITIGASDSPHGQQHTFWATSLFRPSGDIKRSRWLLGNMAYVTEVIDNLHIILFSHYCWYITKA